MLLPVPHALESRVCALEQAALHGPRASKQGPTLDARALGVGRSLLPLLLRGLYWASASGLTSGTATGWFLA